MKVVISQPMFFPWVGMFEQIRLADVYVHYSDVQFSKGSFVNRVQIKTEQGSKWLTVPLVSVSLGRKINEVCIDNGKNWKKQHLQILSRAYQNAPYLHDMLAIVEAVYKNHHVTIDTLSEASINEVCHYFNLDHGKRIVHSTDFQINGTSSRRVLDITRAASGDKYITGHGAQHYLNHELFEENSVQVHYMDYRKTPYPQQYGEFTPFVSVLDLVANMGRKGEALLNSGTIYWKNFIHHE